MRTLWQASTTNAVGVLARIVVSVRGSINKDRDMNMEFETSGTCECFLCNQDFEYDVNDIFKEKDYIDNGKYIEQVIRLFVICPYCGAKIQI